MKSHHKWEYQEEKEENNQGYKRRLLLLVLFHSPTNVFACQRRGFLPEVPSSVALLL
jgi:hypothetical protein